jgi:nucleoside-diphosphate-sugar epimerase
VPYPEQQKKIEIGNYYADYSKITRAVGWQPRTPLLEGIQKTVEFFRKHRQHYWG